MIEGLAYITDFIDQNTHDELLQKIDAGIWLNDLKRRVQHYGYKYNYTAKAIDHTMKIGPLPEWSENLCNGILEPDQLIVNEYLPGQGIANHIDCVPCFNNVIASLSLGSPCVMNFIHKFDGKIVSMLLEPKSLLVLQGEARYNWTHGIPARKFDSFDGKVIERQRRVSLTFRKVIL